MKKIRVFPLFKTILLSLFKNAYMYCIYIYLHHIHICIHIYLHHIYMMVAQKVKCLPTMREIRVQSLGQEDPLEKQMATHSSILAWKVPWMEKSGRQQSMGSQRVRHD